MLRALILVTAGCAATMPQQAQPVACASHHAILRSVAEARRIGHCQHLASMRIRGGWGGTANLSLAALLTVAGDLEIGPSVGLDTLTLPRLTKIGGRLQIHHNFSLTAMFAPALHTVGGLAITDNSGLITLALEQLANITGAAAVQRNGSLATVLMPQLRSPVTLVAPQLEVLLCPGCVR